MSAPHVPPITTPSVDTDSGLPTPQQALWNQQLLQSRSAWTPYTPTVTGLGGSPTINAAYVQNGKTTFFRIQISGTSDGSLPTVTLPFTPVSTLQGFAGILSAANPKAIAVIINNAAGQLKLAFYDGTAPTNGVAYDFRITGVFEAA